MAKPCDTLEKKSFIITDNPESAGFVAAFAFWVQVMIWGEKERRWEEKMEKFHILQLGFNL